MTKSRRGLLLGGVFGAPVFLFGNEVQRQQQQHNTVRQRSVSGLLWSFPRATRTSQRRDKRFSTEGLLATPFL
jgi:hypothetical protein